MSARTLRARGGRTSKTWGLLAGLCLLTLSATAYADRGTIKFPGDHPNYAFELEPHGLLEPFHDFHPGVGVRGTIEIVDNGFITKINNTVGIGFGLDWTSKSVWVPVVMQWNFWLSENWSVFGEPGAVLRISDEKKKGLDYFAVYAGGRFHFSDTLTLTMRVGKPTASVGVSFLF